MPAFKIPGFQERQEAAAVARTAALAKLQAKPPVDEAVVAERAARRQAKEAAQAAKRAAAMLAKEEAAEAKRQRELQAALDLEAAKAAQAAQAAQAKLDATAQKVAERKLWTEEDRKAARDARYAARKSRQARK